MIARLIYSHFVILILLYSERIVELHKSKAARAVNLLAADPNLSLCSWLATILLSHDRRCQQ